MIYFKLYRTLPLAIEQALMLGGDQSRPLVGNDPSDFLADVNMEGGTKPLRLAVDLVIHWCERVPTCLFESVHLR
jgi:hypothetical protein